MKYTFDTEQVRNLVQGNYRFFPCLDCNGKGSVLVDGDAGLVVESVASGKDTSSYYMDCCDSCNGLGGRLHIG